ncbi:MAG: hypothetical protein U0840_01190 [Gemmataceae bacterium]
MVAVAAGAPPTDHAAGADAAFTGAAGLDNLAGYKTPAFVLWLFAHGILPLFTPLGGSWLNMAESIQRVQKQRAGGATPDEPGRGDRPVHSGRAPLERGTDAVRVGREACRTEEARTGASACGRRLGCLHSATAPTQVLWP